MYEEGENIEEGEREEGSPKLKKSIRHITTKTETIQENNEPAIIKT